MIKGALALDTNDFLQQAYIELDLQNGDLVEVKNTNDLDEREYINKAQWLNLCRYISQNKSFKAESIFFVENNPVIVFVNATEAHQNSLHEIYNQIWCMANPRLLFISTPAELNVYDLANKPARKKEELNPLETVRRVTEISSTLKRFRRESVESGEVFGDERFGKIDSRADKALIEDIKTVRAKLFKEGLSDDKLKYAHALIGRSIFIRYLEDRRILTKDYFYKVAENNAGWKKLLEEKPSKPDLYPGMGDLLYLKVLSNIDFTYCLYKKLADDFNGDMFPTDQNEKKSVRIEHLLLLQKFLKGDVQEQESLFFWAYKFDIIPIELISNIYEELYHFEDLNIDTQENKKKRGNHGTHYTPASLVEFVIKKVLTIDRLKRNPRIIDPSCGSGIFLVEAFRRIIRYKLHKNKSENLSFSQLEEILKNQIGGIELNAEAVRITAFSLYLAFLHYQTPPDILQQIKQGNKLPNLIFTGDKEKDKKYFDILIHSNAFTIEESIHDEKVRKNFSSNCADIVVGNPPWGKVHKDDKTGNKALKWCESKKKVVSNRELSQAFIWKAIDLLKDRSTAALLVSSGVILQSSGKSNLFKQNLLRSVRVQEVVNFVHVRQLFFSSAISPFISIVFNKEIHTPDAYIDYWTARRTKAIENAKIVVLDNTDFKFFKYSDTATEDIWKIYFLGNHRDHSLISGLRLFPQLKTFETKNLVRRQGFKESEKGRKDSGWLKKYKELPTDALDNRYGSIDIGTKLRPVPPKVREKGTPEIYEGMRILIRGGPAQKGYQEKGQIIARFHTETFAFRHSVNCIKLDSNKEEDYKVLLGILWSSLLRYYFLMTSSKWPIWHYQIYLEEILNMPVIFPDDKKLKARIINIVNKLRNYKLKALGSKIEIRKLERELDEAIFELYMLTEAECDLIRDRCKYDIDIFYNPSVIHVEFGDVTSGTFQSLSSNRDIQKGLEGYLYVFLKSWNPELENGKELNWQIIRHPTIPMIAVIFTQQNIREEKGQDISPDEISEWRNTLSKLEKETQIPYSQKVYIEGIVRVVTKNQIIIIKRNEERLWTRSAAYEDVEATLLQAVGKKIG
jgi:type I restriction-modification system DNA methylase subunit